MKTLAFRITIVLSSVSVLYGIDKVRCLLVVKQLFDDRLFQKLKVEIKCHELL